MQRFYKAFALSLALAGPVQPASGQIDDDSTSGGVLTQSEVRNSELGDVVYSILPPELFEQTHEGRWVLLDGADLASETGLYKFLEKQGRLDILSKDEGPVKLFDARGMFLRGVNLARNPEEGDPAGSDRAVGSTQLDQVGKHEHDISYPAHIRRAGNGANNKFDAPWSDNAWGPRKTERIPNPENPADTETRPRNIALYIYIKIGD